MTVNPNNANIAAARTLLDRALSAERGIRVAYPATGDSPTAQGLAMSEAKAMHRYIGNARSAARRLARSIAKGEGQPVGLGSSPDAPSTAYDGIDARVHWDGDRNAAILTLRKPDVDALTIEEL